jgi:hypothetical protein
MLDMLPFAATVNCSVAPWPFVTDIIPLSTKRVYTPGTPLFA